uniref:Uncharacterized protein n=1 Tax=Podarcis muralis TaxID=64176 RepID=A0A670JDG2_PODMU
ISMWNKSVCVALLALATGYVFLLDSDLPDSVLKYLSSSFLYQLQGDLASPESSMAAAWEVLITQPGKQWNRVAWSLYFLLWRNLFPCTFYY